MVLNERQKKLIEEETNRLRKVLIKEKIVIVDLKVRDIEEDEMETIEKVKKFMEEATEKTDKKTDVLGTSELLDKYIKWNTAYNQKMNQEKPVRECGSMNYIETVNLFGKYLTNLNYSKWKAKQEGKTVRGYGYLKYKGESDDINVKEFMEKYTEKTESVKDRISIQKLLPKYWRDNRERYGIETFKYKLIKYGYQTKAAKETQRVEGRYGKEKVIKVGEIVNCVLKVKLKNEFFREEWTA